MSYRCPWCLTMIPNSPLMWCFIDIAQSFSICDVLGCQIHFTRSPTFMNHLIQTTSMPSVVRSFFELYPYSSSISLKRSDYPYTLASRFNNCWLYQITDFHLQSPDVCSEHILYLLRKEYRLVI